MGAYGPTGVRMGIRIHLAETGKYQDGDPHLQA